MITKEYGIHRHHGLEVTIEQPEWWDATLAATIRESGSRLISVDTETTGFLAHPGSVTEVGWFDLGAGVGGCFIPPHDITTARPQALEVSRYAERIAGQPVSAEQVPGLHQLLGGDGTPVHIVGSNPQFDQEHLATLFEGTGLSPRAPWKRRAIDVAQGGYWLGLSPIGTPPGLAETCDALDIDRSGHHAALDDALMAAHIFFRLKG